MQAPLLRDTLSSDSTWMQLPSEFARITRNSLPGCSNVTPFSASVGKLCIKNCMCETRRKSEGKKSRAPQCEQDMRAALPGLKDKSFFSLGSLFGSVVFILSPLRVAFCSTCIPLHISVINFMVPHLLLVEAGNAAQQLSEAQARLWDCQGLARMPQLPCCISWQQQSQATSPVHDAVPF